MSSHFSLWLGKKLTELGTDDSVFGPYIISILEVLSYFHNVNSEHHASVCTTMQFYLLRVFHQSHWPGWRRDCWGEGGGNRRDPFRCAWWRNRDQSNTCSGKIKITLVKQIKAYFPPQDPGSVVKGQNSRGQQWRCEKNWSGQNGSGWKNVSNHAGCLKSQKMWSITDVNANIIVYRRNWQHTPLRNRRSRLRSNGESRRQFCRFKIPIYTSFHYLLHLMQGYSEAPDGSETESDDEDGGGGDQ